MSQSALPYQAPADPREAPRIATALPASVRYRAIGTGHAVVCDAVIRSLSPHGAGVELLAPMRTQLERGAPVIVRFSIEGMELELPGTVAWFRCASEISGLFDVGLQLRPELAPATVRTVFSVWVRKSTLAVAGGATRPRLTAR